MSSISFIKTVFKVILHQKKAIINVHSDGMLISLFVMFLSLFDKRNSYYLTVHGIYSIEAQMAGNAQKFYIILEKNIYKYFPNLICVSEMLQKNILNIYGRSKNIRVIPNGTNAEIPYKIKTLFADGNIHFVSLGGLQNRKGIEETITLISYLTKHFRQKIILDIYGREEGAKNHKWFQEKAAKERICATFHGCVNDKAYVYKILQNADFQLCLSKYDTFNVSIAESLVLGCICIASNNCGASYLISNGVNGLVVDPKSDSFLSEVAVFVQKMIDEPNRDKKILELAIEAKQKLSWECIAHAYSELP